jgi:hypothetical protein
MASIPCTGTCSNVRRHSSGEPTGPRVVTQIPGPESLNLLHQLDQIQVYLHICQWKAIILQYLENAIFWIQLNSGGVTKYFEPG